MRTLDELKQELQRMINYRHSPEESEKVEVVEFDLSQDIRNIVAIDGSYSFLWNLSSMWLAIVRAGALKYSFSKDGYHILGCDFIERPIMVSTWEKIVSKQDELHQYLFDFTKGSKEQHKEMVNEYRKRIEGEIALKASKENRKCIIALDGTLTSFPKELDCLGEVVETCERNENMLVGVSKDSMTHAFGSARTDEEFLKGKEGMAFVRLPSSFEKKQKGLLYGDVYFVKLHPKAAKWFRIDIGTFKSQPKTVFSNLAHYAQSGLCLGYPYPLVEAHRFAVTVRQFREMYEDFLIRTAMELGVEVTEIVNGLTHFEGDRKDAFHEYLDKVAREVK